MIRSVVGGLTKKAAKAVSGDGGNSFSRYWIPRNFTVTLYNPDGVDQQDAIITWTAHPTRETEIYRNLDGAGFALLTTIAPNVGTYTDSLFDGETHSVDYKARFKQDTTVLSTTTGLTLTEVSNGIKVDFTENNTEHDVIEIWADINSAGYALLTSVNKGTATYTHVIATGNTIKYKIRAKEGTLPVYSSFTDEQTITRNIVDQDGNIYTQITIGTQTWMVENWKSTKFNDGSTIPLCADAAAITACWGEGAAAVYMSWLGGNVANKALYGGLYTHAAIRSAKGFCPAGWHIPTTAELTTLANYLGGAAVAGGHMKSDGTTYWNSDNADNSPGFDARGEGRATTSWSEAKANGYYWCYGYSGNYAEQVSLQTGDTILTFVSQLQRQSHLSVRLIKDQLS